VPEQVDGISMLATLRGEVGEQKTHETLYFEFIRGEAKPYSARALRYGDWKAVQRSQGKKGKSLLPIELYNLKQDLSEENDLAGQYPELLQKMEKFMDEAHTPLKK